MKSILKTGLSICGFAIGLFASFPASAATAATCEKAVATLNAKLSPKTNPTELVAILKTLNSNKNTKFPAKFVTKKQAQQAGWSPGTSLWSVPSLNGKSIGGDTFFNNRVVSDAKLLY